MPLPSWYRAVLTEDWQQGGFGIYVHWPFCQSKCPYCDFNSHVTASIDQDAWLESYLSEIKRYLELLPGRVVNSIFFGGGTPSLMQPHVVGGVIDAIGKGWTLANDVEISLEANPGSVEAGRFLGYREAGVNRISMGIQALNDPDLRRLGRLHSVSEALQAFDVARSTFSRVSFDLIYARQDQTLADWEAELTRALGYAVDHLSLYQLTIEQGTAFGDRYNRGLLKGLPADDSAADMYDLTQSICADHGMPAYEISNHAGPGAQSRHNLIYWRYGDYVGIGPGAHGRITVGGRKFATEAHRAPGKWLAEVKDGSGDSAKNEVIGPEQGLEYLLMCLRLSEGLDRERYRALAQRDFDPDTLAELRDMGMIVADDQSLQVTEKGRPVLNAILAELAGD